MTRREVGRRLREMREDRALGLCAAAQLAGVDAGNLCRVEHESVRLSAVCAWRLARIYGTPVFELVDVRDLLSHVDIALGERRRELDDAERRLAAFLLPGGVQIMVPKTLAGSVV